MLSQVSICGSGAVGLYIAIMAGNVFGTKVTLHSLRSGCTVRRITVEDVSGVSRTETIQVHELKQLCDVIFLVCDSGRVMDYISEIKKDRCGLTTFIYLLQNGLLSYGCLDKLDNLQFRRISLGRVSLCFDGNVLGYRGSTRPSLEISRTACLELRARNDIAFSTLEAVGDVTIRANEGVVVWNKLVRSGPHFVDTILALQASIDIGSDERLHIARSLFREYWDLGVLASGEQLPDRVEALRLVETLVAKNVPNSGARRYMLQGSYEDFEAVVGRVRKYAVQRGMCVPTLSLVEFAIRNK